MDRKTKCPLCNNEMILFERYPNMELLDKKPKWGRNFIFRGFEHLEIKAN